MQVVIDWILLSFVGFVILLGFYFALRAFIPQRRVPGSYNVGRQEARLARRYDLLRGIIAILIGALLLLVIVFWTDFGQTSPPPVPSTATPPPPAATALPADTPPTPTPPLVTATAAATDLPVSPPTATLPAAGTAPPTSTPTAAAEATVTATTAAQTAVVNSGVGVWLRAVPGVSGEQLEWVLDGTELLLLDQVEVGEEFTWQYVQTPDGNVGWVAAQFLNSGE